MTVRFTPRELDVMSILWERGEATVKDVRESLGDDLAYTSVLSQLQLLESKGHVAHRRDGRAYRYRPLTPAHEAGETALGRVLDRLYQNSPVKLLAQLVETSDVSEDELEEMRRLIDERLGAPGGEEGR